MLVESFSYNPNFFIQKRSIYNNKLIIYYLIFFFYTCTILCVNIAFLKFIFGNMIYYEQFY